MIYRDLTLEELITLKGLLGETEGAKIVKAQIVKEINSRSFTEAL